MTAHEMLWHLNDSFSGVLGGRPIAPADTWPQRTAVTYVAHTILAWPKGLETRPDADHHLRQSAL